MAKGAAEVRRQVANVKMAMLAVYRGAALRTIQEAQRPVAAGGNMPVRSGFLRFSGEAGVGDYRPTPIRHPGGLNYTWDEGQAVSVIASATFEDKITFVWRANYAVFQEYGSRGRDGRRFRGLAVQNWHANVEAVAEEVSQELRR